MYLALSPLPGDVLGKRRGGRGGWGGENRDRKVNIWKWNIHVSELERLN